VINEIIINKLPVFLIFVIMLISNSFLFGSPVDSVTYKYFVEEMIYTSPEYNTEASIEINYIEIINAPYPAVKDSINTFINNYGLDTYDSYDDLMQNFIDEFIDAQNYYPSSFGWEDRRRIYVSCNSNYILSLSFRFFSYSGGAHPNGWEIFFNFNLYTGEVLKLENLFTESQIKELNSIAEIKFREIYDIEEGASLEKYGFWFDDNKFELNDNFLITDKGLIFLFNPYEITAYVIGSTTIEITYNDIKDLIRRDSMLYLFIK